MHSCRRRRVFRGLLLLPVLLSAGARAAEPPPPPPGDLGGILHDGAADLTRLWSRESLDWLVIGAAATGSLAPVEDAEGARRALDHGWRVSLADIGNVWGGARVQVPLAIGLWAGGCRLGDDRLAATGYDVARGLVWTHATAGVLKHAVDRTRPDGEGLSFPSGHTASAFTLAGVVSRRYGGWRSAGCLGLGVLTALGRIEARRHHPTDVAAGATLGWLVGRAVSRRTGGGEAAWRLLPTGGGLALVRRF